VEPVTNATLPEREIMAGWWLVVGGWWLAVGGKRTA
jgi:hypothetical protein